MIQEHTWWEERKEVAFVLTAPHSVKGAFAASILSLKGLSASCPQGELTVSGPATYWPPSLLLLSFPLHQKRAKSTNGNSATMLINGSWPTGAWYIFSFIRVDYLTSYSPHPPSHKFPKLLVTLLFCTSVATLYVLGGGNYCVTVSDAL